MIPVDNEIQTLVVNAPTVQLRTLLTFASKKRGWRADWSLRPLVWLCLLLVCAGTSWFSYQSLLVPHTSSFSPDWQGAQWVAPATISEPIAYYRYTTDVNALPDGAFITIAASQTFRVYVNETLIGSNALDFAQGNFPRAYMYDVLSALRLGQNVVAVRVANVDGKSPMLRLSMGMVRGQTSSFYDTQATSGWQGTTNSATVHLRFETTQREWTKSYFDASSWPAVVTTAVVGAEPMLFVNPQVYEHPAPTQWMSVGSGHEAYFVRQLTVPFGTKGIWLRLVATGTARIFINGYLFMVWNGQATVPPQRLGGYLSDDTDIVQYRTGLVLGVYNISTYLHPGINTLAIHVSAPGILSTRTGLGTLNAALALDLLKISAFSQDTWLSMTSNWHAASQPVSNWAQGSSIAMTWAQPIPIGRPGVAQAFYLSDTPNPRSQQYMPILLIAIVIIASFVGVISLWLLMANVLLRRFGRPWHDCLVDSVLPFLPALACETLLLILTREPQIARPFPYTPFWACLLLALVGISYVVLKYNYHLQFKSTTNVVGTRFIASEANLLAMISKISPLMHSISREQSRAEQVHAPTKTGEYQNEPGNTIVKSVEARGWLRAHWGLLAIMVIAIPLIGYNLPYEPYWQDELTSYYAARGVLAHGLPIMPSGFLYAKAELYSYVLAFCIALFGDKSGLPRMVSIVEYLLSLPLLYVVGSYFFGRRVALLATAMLAFSPLALVWGRQMRMYEQAQLFTLLVVYLLYRALHERQRPRLIYLACGTLVLTYLSHEETFIILPAVLFCVVWIKSKEYVHEHRDKSLSELWKLYKHWIIAGTIAASCIAGQLLLARYSHPTVLGTDQSQRPLIQFTTDNIPYYLYLLFYPVVLGHGEMPLITLNSLLAMAGCIIALRGTNEQARYCILFLLLSLLTLTFAFTMATDRYIYPILPLYYLSGSYALLLLTRRLWRFVCSRVALPQHIQGSVSVAAGYITRPVYRTAMATLLLICIAVLLLPILPISSYNLFVSQQVGFSYHKHYPDYDNAGQYLQQHIRKGDVVIAVSPAISVLYYVGHVDYFFSLNRALYLFERNGHIIDTPTGSVALLNQDDFQAVIAAHTRVWIVSDNGLYQAEAMKDNRFLFPPDFHIVYEGYGSAIYSNL